MWANKFRLLAIGAHPDDVELGCGASLALLKKRGHEVHVLVLTKGEASGDPGIRTFECKKSARTICVSQLLFGETWTQIRDDAVNDGH